MISTRLPETRRSAASAVTAARIGPAHGVQTTDERGSEHEARRESVPAREPAARARRERLEQPARPLGEQRREQHQPDEGEQHDGDRVQEILRQAERGEHPRCGQRERDEREREAERDAQRPATAARRPGGEHDGHDRQHTGREERGQTGDHGREDQRDAHGAIARPCWHGARPRWRVVPRTFRCGASNAQSASQGFRRGSRSPRLGREVSRRCRDGRGRRWRRGRHLVVVARQ